MQNAFQENDFVLKWFHSPFATIEDRHFGSIGDKSVRIILGTILEELLVNHHRCEHSSEHLRTVRLYTTYGISHSK